MVPKIDRETLTDLQKGDMMAFERVLNLYEEPILNYIFRMTKQREDAEDLTQDTFVQLYKSASQIDPDNNFRGWLYKVATNNVLDWLRKKNKIKEVPIITEDEKERYAYGILIDQLPASAPNFHDSLDIQRALQKLNSTHQTVLDLFYYHDFGNKEISEILGMPVGTIKTHLRKARIELRQILYKEGFAEKTAAEKESYELSLSKN